MSSIMQTLLAGNNLSQLKENTIIPGTVIEIRPNEVVIDIGAKSEGVVPIAEFNHIDDLQVGLRWAKTGLSALAAGPG